MSDLDILKSRRPEAIEQPLTGELILDVFKHFAQYGRPASNQLIDSVITYIRAGIDWNQPTWQAGFRLRVSELRYGTLRHFSDSGAAQILTDRGRREFTGNVHAINADALSLVFCDESGKLVEAIPVIDRFSLEPLVDIEIIEDPNLRGAAGVPV